MGMHYTVTPSLTSSMSTHVHPTPRVGSRAAVVSRTPLLALSRPIFPPHPQSNHPLRGSCIPKLVCPCWSSMHCHIAASLWYQFFCSVLFMKLIHVLYSDIKYAYTNMYITLYNKKISKTRKISMTEKGK